MSNFVRTRRSESSSFSHSSLHRRCLMVSAVLDRQTLVLNRSWQPVGVAPVARSLVLLWNDNARVVDPQDYQLYTWADWSRLIPRQDEPFIQAVRMRLRVPEVVALTKYDRLPTNAVTFSGGTSTSGTGTRASIAVPSR